MVGALAPIAIFLGVSATVVFTFFSFWGSVSNRATKKTRTYVHEFDRAGIVMKPQEIVLTGAGLIALVWIGLTLLLHPPLLIAGLILLGLGLSSYSSFYFWLKFKIRRRLDTFITQLELALRLIAGGTKVGLGLRQALTIVIEELPDPARYEFLRVIGQTNIGISILDAMDDLAARMPSNETLMMARVMRIQSQSGGDLARVLEQLAATIKGRRQVQRKISSLTAEGRMSALVLLAIPLALGLFMVTTQGAMGQALLFTRPGQIVLLIIAVLETIGFLWLRNILKVNV